MKDTKKILRTAIFNALSGNLTYNAVAVPVREEKLASNQSPDLFVILSNQQENDEERQDQTWITRSSIDIEIIHKTGSEVSKDPVDDVYEDILEIIFPTSTTYGLTVPANFQFLGGFRESCQTQVAVISETESIIVERFKLTFTITQQ